VQLGQRFGWIVDRRVGGSGLDTDLICMATLSMPVSLEGLTAQVARTLNREPLVIGEPDREIRRVAWCTGGAQGYFDAAIAAGADVYLSGEISEPTTHLARESGVAYIRSSCDRTLRRTSRRRPFGRCI